MTLPIYLSIHRKEGDKTQGIIGNESEWKDVRKNQKPDLK